MVNRRKIATLFALVVVALCASYTLSAQSFSYYNGAYVLDNANVFSSKTIAILEEKLQTLSQKIGSTQIIATVTATDNRAPEAYADDLFEELCGINTEGSLLLIVTSDTRWNSTGRYVHLSTSGSHTIDTISDKRVDSLLTAFIKSYRKGAHISPCYSTACQT